MLYYLCFNPSDRCGTLSAIGSAIGSPCLACLLPFKTNAKPKRNRGRDLQPRPRPQLNSQPQGATKNLRSPSSTSDPRLLIISFSQSLPHPLVQSHAVKVFRSPPLASSAQKRRQGKQKKSKARSKTNQNREQDSHSWARFFWNLFRPETPTFSYWNVCYGKLCDGQVGNGEWVITKGVFSLNGSLQSPKSLKEVIKFSFVFHTLWGRWNLLNPWKGNSCFSNKVLSKMIFQASTTLFIMATWHVWRLPQLKLHYSTMISRFTMESLEPHRPSRKFEKDPYVSVLSTLTVKWNPPAPANFSQLLANLSQLQLLDKVAIASQF